MGNATSSTPNKTPTHSESTPAKTTTAEKAAVLSMDKQFITALDQNAIILNDIKRLQDVEKGLYAQLNKLMTPVAVSKGPTCDIQSCPDGFHKATNTKECQGKACCCVAPWSNDCGESCAHDKCNKAGLKWVPLDYSDHQYTCVSSAASVDPSTEHNKPGMPLSPTLPSKDNLAARESILQQINDIVEIRVNLFKKIRNEYTESQQNLAVQSQDLTNQKRMVELVEDELSTVRKNVNNLSTNQDTQLRMVEIGNYQFQKYQAHKALIKVIFYCTIIILLASVLIQVDLLPGSIGSVVIAVTFVVCCIMVIWKLSDMYSRSNMNYNQFVFDKPAEGASSDSGESVWQYDKRAFEQTWRDTKSDVSSADEYVDKETKSIFGTSKPKGTPKGTPKGATASKPGLMSSIGTHIKDEASDIMGTAATIL